MHEISSLDGRFDAFIDIPAKLIGIIIMVDAANLRHPIIISVKHAYHLFDASLLQRKDLSST